MALNRVSPALPIGSYTTYGVRVPRDTHTRLASCDEVNCPAYTHGWATTVDESTPLGQQQAYYIRKQSGRGYKEDRTEGGLTRFTFPPGQTCFQEHRVRTELQEIFIARPGDWRKMCARHEIYVHKRADDWVDDFATNQIRLAEIVQRG